MIVMCPVCASRDLREKNVAYAEIRVTTWEHNGPDGLSPCSWDWDVDAEWETAPDEKSYVCHGFSVDGERCTWEGDVEDLLVADDNGDPLTSSENV